jgi:hypothetical protein
LQDILNDYKLIIDPLESDIAAPESDIAAPESGFDINLYSSKSRPKFDFINEKIMNFDELSKNTDFNIVSQQLSDLYDILCTHIVEKVKRTERTLSINSNLKSVLNPYFKNKLKIKLTSKLTSEESVISLLVKHVFNKELKDLLIEYVKHLSK